VIDDDRPVLLPVVPPFSLRLTVAVLQRLPGNVLDGWDAATGTYTRAVRLPSRPALVHVRQVGADRLELDGAAAAAPLVRRMLGLDVQVNSAALAAAEPRLVPVLRRLRGLRPPRFPSLFETIGLTVPFQQLSLESGQSIVNRLVRQLGQPVGSAWLFPAPARIAGADLADLRCCGLSRSKAETLRAVARLIADGELSEADIDRCSSPEALRRLDQLPGVGLWTAGVILLRGFGRLDVFPSGDVGARRGLATLLGRDRPLDAGEEQALLERLGPQRGLVYFLLLGWSRLRLGV
jgi:3-methyladenine DNA glycosylase/8-oxoguanine DNA glycosylase